MADPTPIAATDNRLKLKPFGQLFSEAWQIYSSRWKLLVGIMLIPNGIIFIGDLLGKTASDVFGLIGSIISIFAQVALFLALANEGQLSIGEAYRRARPLFWGILIVSVFASLTTVGGLSLFLIPGIWIGVLVMFAPLIVVLEGVHGWEALQRSRAYVQGRWWDVFIPTLLFGLVSIPAGIVFALFGVGSSKGIVNAVVGLLFNSLWVTLGMVFTYRLYINVKETVSQSALAKAPEYRRTFVIFSVLGIVGFIVMMTTMFFVLAWALTRFQ